MLGRAQCYRHSMNIQRTRRMALTVCKIGTLRSSWRARRRLWVMCVSVTGGMQCYGSPYARAEPKDNEVQGPYKISLKGVEFKKEQVEDNEMCAQEWMLQDMIITGRELSAGYKGGGCVEGLGGYGVGGWWGVLGMDMVGGVRRGGWGIEEWDIKSGRNCDEGDIISIGRVLSLCDDSDSQWERLCASVATKSAICNQAKRKLIPATADRGEKTRNRLSRRNEPVASSRQPEEAGGAIFKRVDVERPPTIMAHHGYGFWQQGPKQLARVLFRILEADKSLRSSGLDITLSAGDHARIEESTACDDQR
ncbi:hypothetical protein Tco_0073277 [Tanacetum coccineum]